MVLSKLSLIFKILILGAVYLIIFYALKIIYKDIKNGGKKERSRSRTFGLEVVEAGKNANLKSGSILPITRELTMGRKEDNMVILHDPYSSGYHVRIYARNNEYFLEDLGSTNGTELNKERVTRKEKLKVGDEIRIGSSLFKVIG